jgi:hypothetical protein
MAVRVGRADRAYVAPRRDPDEFLWTQPRLGRQSSSRRGLSSATNRAFRERSSSSRRIFLAACSSRPQSRSSSRRCDCDRMFVLGARTSGEPAGSAKTPPHSRFHRDRAVANGSYRALHQDPGRGLSSHPGFVSVRALCAARARSHLGACLSDLVRKFAHAFGVRTQWPPRKRARVRPRRGTAAYRPERASDAKTRQRSLACTKGGARRGCAS